MGEEASKPGTFQWGETIDDQMRYLNMTALRQLCKALPRAVGVWGWSRKELYEFVTRQALSDQRTFYDGGVSLLAAGGGGCTKEWLRKRRMEDEQFGLRVVKAKIEKITEGLRMNGGE